MIKFENVEFVGFEHALRGMSYTFRNCCRNNRTDENAREQDYDTLKCFASNIHVEKNRDYLKMLQVYVDITAPLYFWSEFDSYNIRSLYDLIPCEIYFRKEEFTRDDFSLNEAHDEQIEEIDGSITMLNLNLHKYNNGHETEDGGWYITHRDYWQMLRLLPSSYNQRRTVCLTYKELKNIYETSKYRHNYIPEWETFRQFVRKLPYSELITAEDDERERILKEESRKHMVEKFKKG